MSIITLRADNIRMLGYLSAKTFGAVGDGVADDRVAIQQALDTASALGCELFIPPGVYICGRSASNSWCLDIPANATIRGIKGQTWLKQPAGLPNSSISLTRINGVQNVTIRDIGFDGNWGNYTTTVSSASNQDVLPQSTINVMDASEFAASGSFQIVTSAGLETITYTGRTDTAFTGCSGGVGEIITGSPLGVTNSQNGINQTTQVDPKNHCIMMRGCENVVIENCIFKQAYGDFLWAGFEASDNTIWSRNIRVMNCDGFVAARNGISFGQATDGLYLFNCNFHDVWTTALDVEPVGSAQPVRNVTAEHCFFDLWWYPEDPTRTINSSVSITGGAPSLPGPASNASGFRIRDCVIRGSVYIHSATDVVISQNRIFCDFAGYSYAPVFINHVVDDISVLDNYIYDRSTDPPATPIGTSGHIGAVHINHYGVASINYQPATVSVRGNKIHARNGRRGVMVNGTGGFADGGAGGLRTPTSGTATAVTANSMTHTGAGWTVNEWTGWVVYIDDAIGTIESNTSDTLTIGAWSTPTGTISNPPAVDTYVITTLSGVVDIAHNDIDCTDDGYGAGGLGVLLYFDRSGERVRIRENNLKNPTTWGVQVTAGDAGKVKPYLEIVNNVLWNDGPSQRTTAFVRFDNPTNLSILKMASNSTTGPYTIANVSGMPTSALRAWLELDGSVQTWAGYGSPEGHISAPVGSVYRQLDEDGRLWCKTSGTGRTGWNWVQSSLAQRNLIRIYPNGGSNSVVTTGSAAITNTGITSRAFSATNMFTGARRVGYVSPASANERAGYYAAVVNFWRGDTPGAGGFRCTWRFGISDAVLNTTARMFVGLINSTGIFTDVDPSTLINLLGFGCDSGDTELQLYAAGGAAQARTSLGANFPVNTTNVDVFEASLFSAPNGPDVKWQITRLNTGDVASGTISAAAQLPSATTPLGHRAYRTTGATATAVGIDLFGFYGDSDI